MFWRSTSPGSRLSSERRRFAWQPIEGNAGSEFHHPSWEVSEIDDLLHAQALGFRILLGRRVDDDFHSFERRFAVVGSGAERIIVNGLRHETDRQLAPGLDFVYSFCPMGFIIAHRLDISPHERPHR